eukprot:CFRG4017T1
MSPSIPKEKKQKKKKNDNPLIGQVVVPGDVVVSISEKETVVGPGLRQVGENIVADKAGVLRWMSPNAYWLDSSQRRYVPVKDDRVIGIVCDRMGDGFKIDVGASQFAALPYLSFENVTKKNRPDYKVGDLVYARLVVANKNMEPELSCVNAQEKANGMGGLVGGFSFHCSSGLCHRLLKTKCTVADVLGEKFPYEMTVGMNGIVWVKADSLDHTMIVANALVNSEFLHEAEIKSMVKKLSQQS